VSAVVALLITAWGSFVVLSKPVTHWFAVSAAIWMALQLGSILWLLRGSFAALAAAALTTAIVGRLFSTVALEAGTRAVGSGASDLLLQVETGAGIPGFAYIALLLGMLLLVQFISLAAESVQSSKSERELLVLTWALTFVRLYVALMFVPHFVGHIFAGPHQFGIYTQYFAGLKLPLPAAQLVLAGSVEVLAALGLAFGLCTRVLAILGAVYLFLTMLWGGHFAIGYVWILPDGGYEFGVFWAAIVAVFAVIGGGRVSVDNRIRQTGLFERRPDPRAVRLLFA